MTQINWVQVNIGSFLFAFWFDGKIFCAALSSGCPSRKRRGKTPRQIHYISYCEWVFEITKIQQEVTFKHYNYPEEVLNYIRALVLNDMKGEILGVWYKASLKGVCEALQNQLLQYFIGSQFWKI